MIIGKKCYLLKGKKVTGNNLIYLEGIGTVYIEPAYPKQEIIDNRYIGFISSRADIKCESYFYDNIFFVFPLLPVSRNINNNLSTTPRTQYNEIKVSSSKAIKISRQLSNKGISTTIRREGNYSYLTIDDITRLEDAKYIVEQMEQNENKFSQGYSKIRDLIKLPSKKKKSPRRIKSNTNNADDYFPEADFELD